YHVLLIGVTGVLFRPFASTLTLLGVQRAAASSLMRNIHVHSVLSVSSLTRTRRRLENDNDLHPP
ncbi:hypothetical protein J0689_25695, partial [Vibrio parahaemolyticus]|uniref:hypothetical protein n=1 Tax=Vibrio parahaemolyticus TaxID=670 RepID=UPI001A8E520E